MQKHYIPTTLKLNVPVSYIAESDDSREVLTGHFAFYDQDGKPYVWAKGGTSYTRAINIDDLLSEFNDIIPCYFVAPVSDRTESVVRTRLFRGCGSIPPSYE